MISKGLLNYVIYRVCKNIYLNYNYYKNKRFKQYFINNNNVDKNISRTYTKENR